MNLNSIIGMIIFPERKTKLNFLNFNIRKRSFMKIYSRKIALLLSLLILCACQDKPVNKADSSKAADTSALSDAKKVMDQVNNTVDTAVNSKMQQLENIDLAAVLSDPEAYLAMNAKNPGVTVTDTGLQYRVITQGSGPKPSTENKVQVHYRGTFPDGSEFDSSYKRNEPAAFKVTGVIKGWTEALLLMNEGSKWELVIPPDLAYGKRGAGNVIPPDQVLKFEVELLKANIE